MKKLASLVAMFAVLIGAARAQIDVEVVMDQGQFLPSEAVPVAVRVINHSGQTLHFGSDDWLSFSVEAQDGLFVSKSGDPPVGHNFDLETSAVATQHADLAPCFTITRTGHYTVVATVKLKDWDSEVVSAPQGFDVIEGVKLWEQEFGLPETSPTNHEEPEVRKYILQEAAYVKHLRLYLRITDSEESRVFRVVAVGPMTSFSQPVTQLDQSNNLHLLYTDGARSYLYAVISPDGSWLMRQKYYYTDNAPRMRTDKSGRIYIAGGARHVTPEDLPAPVPEPLANQLPPAGR